MARSSYYAVRQGRSIGVFRTWRECEESVVGYPDNDYQKCATEDEAWDFVNADGPSSTPSNGRAGATAGWGVWHEDEKYEHLNRSERLAGTEQTNNRAELTAAIEALRGAPRDGKPILHTDSRYTMGIKDWLPGWERNGFRNSLGKPVANQDLVRQLDREIKMRGGNIEWKHVKGHSGIYGNEMADRLAVQGANKAARKASP
ncbi:RnaseH-domain-containing protein [Microstroma glucosiphilum]|uniref:ribonuclease H n=1 Tax=Pseudomicrostroma glucosiphilum TaxID=1684307 RepID=A0A316UAP6_9BASI|nr:RnaseH-domain-containing protein [Pseudomicrostroma glucosiphilum]PWN21541.1 RnaseH-domain-containing protein [Pseudomicrostroma glucosiphilum]